MTIYDGDIQEATDVTILNTPGRWLVDAFTTTLVNADGTTPGLHMYLVENGNRTVIKETFSGGVGGSGIRLWENLKIFDIVTLTTGQSIELHSDLSSAPTATRTGWIAIKLS